MVTIDDIQTNILLDVIDYSNSKNTEEVCGVVEISDGVQKFIKCENIAENKKKFFLINPWVYIDYEILFIFHSHCEGSALPSGLDKKCADLIGLPFLIYSVLEKNFCLYSNKSVTTFKV